MSKEKKDKQTPSNKAKKTKSASEEIPEEEVEIIEKEVTEKEEPLRLQLLRLQADFDNFRKRQVRERAEWIVRANEDLFLELLPIIDHYEMGLKSAEEHQTDDSVAKGFKLVHTQLLDLLGKHNVNPVDAIGEVFDPHVHEALTHMPSDKPAETVVEQIRRGYLLGEKLLRAAQVVVSSGPAEEPPADTSAEEKESE